MTPNANISYHLGQERGRVVRRKTPMRVVRDRFPVLVACTIRKFVMLGERKPRSLNQTMCAKIYNAAELE